MSKNVCWLSVLFGAAILNAAGKPVYFEPNRGQAPGPASYLARTRQASLFIEERSVTATLHDGKSTSFRWTYAGTAGGEAAPRFKPLSPGPILKDYLKGPREKWIRDLPVYEKLSRLGIYRGIDLLYRSNLSNETDPAGIEYDFIVQPNADPAQIRVRFDQGTTLRLLADGSLEAERAGARIRHPKPQAYSEPLSGEGTRNPVALSYQLHGKREFSFNVGRYARSRRLVIDPQVQFFEYLGGEEDDEIVSGGAFVVGNTRSWDFVAGLSDSYNSTLHGQSTDIYFTWQPNASKIYRVTVMGGSGNDRVLATHYGYGWLAIAGETDSRDLPVFGRSQPPYQSAYGGGRSDGFLIFYDVNGQLNEVTYFGGAGEDRVKAVTLAGSHYLVAGETDSADLPGMRSSGRRPAALDGFLCLAATGLPTDYRAFSFRPREFRFFGGDGRDSVNALGLVNGRPGQPATVLVGGETESSDFPWRSPGSSPETARPTASSWPMN